MEAFFFNRTKREKEYEMNEAAQSYWDHYTLSKSVENQHTVTAWQFGGNPDYLAQLVMEGIKTATCSAKILYDKEGEQLPAVGDYSIILNSTDEPVAIIRTTEVEIMPMHQVSEEFAIAEGEGDRTYDYWKRVHIEFFTEELSRYDLEFSEDIILVCERFELVDVKGE